MKKHFSCSSPMKKTNEVKMNWGNSWWSSSISSRMSMSLIEAIREKQNASSISTTGKCCDILFQLANRGKDPKERRRKCFSSSKSQRNPPPFESNECSQRFIRFSSRFAIECQWRMKHIRSFHFESERRLSGERFLSDRSIDRSIFVVFDDDFPSEKGWKTEETMVHRSDVGCWSRQDEEFIDGGRGIRQHFLDDKRKMSTKANLSWLERKRTLRPESPFHSLKAHFNCFLLRCFLVCSPILFNAQISSDSTDLVDSRNFLLIGDLFLSTRTNDLSWCSHLISPRLVSLRTKTRFTQDKSIWTDEKNSIWFPFVSKTKKNKGQMGRIISNDEQLMESPSPVRNRTCRADWTTKLIEKICGATTREKRNQREEKDEWIQSFFIFVWWCWAENRRQWIGLDFIRREKIFSRCISLSFSFVSIQRVKIFNPIGFVRWSTKKRFPLEQFSLIWLIHGSMTTRDDWIQAFLCQMSNVECRMWNGSGRTNEQVSMFNLNLDEEIERRKKARQHRDGEMKRQCSSLVSSRLVNIAHWHRIVSPLCFREISIPFCLDDREKKMFLFIPSMIVVQGLTRKIKATFLSFHSIRQREDLETSIHQTDPRGIDNHWTDLSTFLLLISTRQSSKSFLLSKINGDILLDLHLNRCLEKLLFRICNGCLSLSFVEPNGFRIDFAWISSKIWRRNGDFSNWFNSSISIWWRAKWGKEISTISLRLLLTGKTKICRHHLFPSSCLQPMDNWSTMSFDRQSSVNWGRADGEREESLHFEPNEEGFN